ncbi:MAG: MMPL family transporter [Bacteroidales bacterium]|nr:MMPL family transporter [Bacteroidales bacterium]
MRKFSTLVIKFRAFIIIAFTLLTAFMAYFLKDLKINPDITTYLPKSDSVVARFNYIGRNYSSSLMAIVIVEAEKDVFTKETLEHTSELTTSLKLVEGVDYVTSLTNVLDIKKTDDGFEISRLIEENNLPKSSEELKKIKEYTLGKKLYRGNLVSEDSKYTVIVCRVNQDVDKNSVARKIKESVLSKKFPEKYYFEGVPFQLMNIMDLVIKDLMLLTPLIVLLIAFTLFISFRTFRGILIPVLAVAMGVIWSMGLMSILHVELSPISDAIPVVLFSVGSAYGIHIYNRFKRVVRDKSLKKEQSASALREVGLAVLLAGLTTVMGFLSFVFNAYLNIIKEFGIFSALGVFFVLIISITFSPALLSYFPVEKTHFQPLKAGKFHFLERFLNKLSAFITFHPKKILISSLLLLLGMVAGIPLIKDKIDILNYFRPETDMRITASIMNKEFGGSLPIMVLVRGDIQNPLVLEKMKKIKIFLEQQPDIKNVSYVGDFIEEMNDCMGEGKKIPDSRDKVSNLMFLIEGDDMLRQMINNDKTEAVIQAYVRNVETKRYREIYSSLNKLIESLSTNEITFTQSGMPGIYSNFDDSLMNNLLQSLVLSLVLIFITMIFLLRSIKSAFVGIIPLLFTMVVIFGFMGYAGIALDICTILIASITVGAGIDYSIHFITEYKNHIIKGRSIKDAISNTILISGKSIVINIITVMLGFLVLIFANLLPLVNFGILVAITMCFSGIGAITILPAVITLFNLKLVNKNKIISN